MQAQEKDGYYTREYAWNATLIFMVRALSIIRPVLVEALKVVTISFLYVQYIGTKDPSICLMYFKRITRANYYMVRKLQQT